MMFRGAEQADIPALARLEERVFGRGAWSEGMIRQELEAPARTYLVYEVDGRILAYGGFWFDGEDAELMTIGVDPCLRRRYIGRRLLEELVSQARSDGSGRMLLEVRVDNTPALCLYGQMGFRRLGLRRHYYQPEDVDAYTMVLDLSPRPAPVGPVGGDRNAMNHGEDGSGHE